jgi:hypothetical protein
VEGHFIVSGGGISWVFNGCALVVAGDFHVDYDLLRFVEFWLSDDSFLDRSFRRVVSVEKQLCR